MTHENNPATHLIKQGDKLYWKNPNDDKGFDKTIGLPLFAVRYNEDFERYSEANPIYAIGDWPDKEEFSREEVEIVWQYLYFDKWKDCTAKELDTVYSGHSTRLAARYKGVSAPSIVQAVIDEVERISTEPPKLHTPIETLNHVLSILKKRRSSNTGLGAPIILLEDAINRLEAESARYKGEPKLSDKIGHINCDQEALKNQEFVNAINNMAEMAYNHPTKGQPADINVGQSEEDNRLQEYLINHYNQWCKETKRNGGVLIGSSIREFFVWLQDKKLQESLIEQFDEVVKKRMEEETSPVEQFRAEVIKKLEAERDNIKKYISPGESSYTFFSGAVRVYEKAIEIVKETQIK